jgi:hypothetical protein
MAATYQFRSIGSPTQQLQSEQLHISSKLGPKLYSSKTRKMEIFFATVQIMYQITDRCILISAVEDESGPCGWQSNQSELFREPEAIVTNER